MLDSAALAGVKLAFCLTPQYASILMALERIGIVSRG
jgi:hypothetical protein